MIVADSWSKKKKDIEEVEVLMKEIEETHEDDRNMIAKTPEEMNVLITSLAREVRRVKEEILKPIERLALKII